ncbi:nitroreductase family protein [Nanoarchaeota archaeon]
MADILELIKSRRTVRKYLPKYVDWERVSRILDAGRHAPSSGNVQNWAFIVVCEADLRKELAEACLQQWWMTEAPVHIVVLSEPAKAERYYGVRGERLYTIQNCAAAIENMLLEAHSLGLGTAWVSAFDEDAIRRIVRGEDFVRPQGVITLGWPAETPPRPPKYPLEALVYFNSWRNRIKDPARYMRDYSLIIKRNVEAGKEFLKKTTEKVKEKVKETLGQKP